MASDGPSHLLSLKVMRVSRPELASAWQPFYSSSPSFSAHSSSSILSLQGTAPLPGHPKTLRDFTHASELLMLPSSFGSIQLGETFSSCLCVNNETHVGVELVQMRVEMQTVTNKVPLYETERTIGDTLGGGDTLEHVVHHEIKELGQHVLACTVTYRLPPNARPVPGASEDVDDPNLQTFRKFYKFAVTNPLSVKTKVHASKSPSAVLSAAERDKVFLEVHIQNLTQDSIRFERMRLECTDEWDAKDTNTFGGGDSIFSGSMTLMHPQDMRQYIYILTPKHREPIPPTHAPGSVIPLGRLDISWRSSFGEPGRLLTSMLSRRIPLPPTQPASALPLHLKRFGSVTDNQSRPRSPSLNQSRPGTPPTVHRPASPSMSKPLPLTSVSAFPQSPSTTMLPSRTVFPDLEVILVVTNIPRDSIAVEKSFKISFSLTVSAACSPALPQHRRQISLAIQHISPRKPVQLPVAPVVPEVGSPRVPSSGFSTPGSSTATFNYALAHQKILAASATESRGSTFVAAELTSEDLSSALPPPFYESIADAKDTRSKVIATGPSAVFLPPLEMDFVNENNEPKVFSSTTFDLSYIALQQGFASVGGLRVILVEDEIIVPGKEDSQVRDIVKKTQILKEYDVIGEIWIPT